MMTCERCSKPVDDMAHVAVLVEGVSRRTSTLTHSLEVLDECWVRHIECEVAYEDRGLWKRLWDALRNR